jgi:N-acyl-D-amino-acid deacylase
VLKKEVVSINQVRGGSGTTPAINRANEPVRPKPDNPKILHGIPVTGRDSAGVEALDEVMVRYLGRTNSTAATLAVGSKGEILHSRGYGWSDREKKVPMRPDTLVGIASCEKPITAAAIRRLGREGKLGLDAGLFEFLKIRPQGPVVDQRMKDITIRHLLEHTAGWGSDPATEAAAAARKKGFQEPVPADSKAWLPDLSLNPVPMETFLGFVMTQRLKNEPGAKAEYCNFGFDTLRHVITKVTGRPYIEYFQRELFRPDVVREFKAHDLPRKKGDPPLVWNAETGGISASAPALLKFMRFYWLTGEPRDQGNPLWIMYGSLPGSTALMIWRSDGIDIAALFNGRGAASLDEIRKDLEEAIERLKN